MEKKSEEKKRVIYDFDVIEKIINRLNIVQPLQTIEVAAIINDLNQAGEIHDCKCKEKTNDKG